MPKTIRTLLYFTSTLLYLAICAHPAQASVVITGSRIIYPGDAREKSLQLSNRAPYPNLVQAWVDSGNEDSTAQNADAPFNVTPPMFRIEGNSGQTLRLRFTGEDLAADRESLFFLNVLVIPPNQTDSEGRNQFVVMPRHRLKIFYRPASIAGAQEHLPQALKFSLGSQGQDWLIEARNPTGYYATFAEASVLAGTASAPLDYQSSLAPFSSATWRIPRSHLNGAPQTLRLRLVTDAGGAQTLQIPLHP